MKSERLHRLLDDLLSDHESLAVAELLRALLTSLEAATLSPSTASAQAFRAALAEVETALTEAPSNFISPTYQRMMAELGLTQYFGNGLRNEIRALIARSNLIPSETLATLREFLHGRSELITSMTEVVTGLTRLGVLIEDLPPGAFELGYLLPEELSPQTFEAFTNEVSAVNLLARTFQELAGDEPNSAGLLGVSASDWTFYIELSAGAAVALSTAIEKIVTLFKTNLEIKLLRRQLSERMPELPDAVKDAIDARVAAGMTEVVDAVLASFPEPENAGRRNELRTQLSMRLKWLAKRMESGALLEVRAQPSDIDQVDGVATDILQDQRSVVENTAVDLVNSRTQAVLEMDIKGDAQVFGELGQDEGSQEKA